MTVISFQLQLGWLLSFTGADGSWYQPQQDRDPDHIIVLQHGLHGFPGQFDEVTQQLAAKMPKEALWFITPNQSRTLLQTHQDILVGARNIADTIKEQVQVVVNRFGARKRRLSMLGHSLGGIYLRACIGLLEEEHWFENNADLVEPSVFLTFATPHLGTRPILNMAGMRGSTIMAMITDLGGKNMLAAQAICYGVTGFLKTAFGTAGRQLVLEDQDKLLVQMADPQSTYIRGLQRFKRHLLMVNCADDIQVPFYTSSITMGVPEPISNVPPEPSEEMNVRNLVVRKSWPHSETTAWQAALAHEDDIGMTVQKMCSNLSQAVQWHRRYFYFTTLVAHQRILFDIDSMDAAADFLSSEEQDLVQHQEH